MNEEEMANEGFDTTHQQFKVHQSLLQKMVGCLLYCSGFTRPDITYATHYISRFVNYPNTKILNETKRIIKYLMNTKEYVIVFKYQDHPHIKKPFALQIYTDADYAQDTVERKSTISYTITYHSAPLDWKTKTTPLVCQSSGESELQAAILGSNNLVWIVDLLNFLGIDYRSQNMENWERETQDKSSSITSLPVIRIGNTSATIHDKISR